MDEICSNKITSEIKADTLCTVRMNVKSLEEISSWLFESAGDAITTEEPEYNVIGELPPVSDAWSDALAAAKDTLKIPYDLRQFQEQSARSLYNGKDVILLR